MEQIEKILDHDVGLEGVTERHAGCDFVMVASAHPLVAHIAGFFQFGDDPLGCSLGNTDLGGDVASSNVGVLGDAVEDVRVVGEEGP